MAGARKKTLTVLLGLLAGAVLLCGNSVQARQVKLDVEMSEPVMLAGKTQKAVIKIGLTGMPIERIEKRTPVNVSIVLDRSGSMSGHKLRKAKEAAKMAIGRLSDRDIVSVVAYNHNVDVLVPATRIRDRHEIYRRIDRLSASGNTALFAGVSKGSYEVRKFMDDNYMNRVILLSDGLANVGPSSTGELADLGYSLGKEGVSVTTIGLGGGYNEDLMAELARSSDGNHAFAETADDLATIFNYEFGDLLSVVARNVIIEIKCGSGIRPIRVIGRDADIHGRNVFARLNQVYADQEKFIMLEVEVPASTNGSRREVASVSIKYNDTISRSTELVHGRADVRFSDSWDTVQRNQNKDVIVTNIEILSNESTRTAIRLRDQGRTREAQKVLQKSADDLEEKARKYGSSKLKKRASRKRSAAGAVAAPASEWKVNRKKMRKEEYELDQQQAW